MSHEKYVMAHSGDANCTGRARGKIRNETDEMRENTIRDSDAEEQETDINRYELARRAAREQDFAKDCERQRQKRLRCKRKGRRRVVGNKGWKLAAGYGVHYVPWCGDKLLYFSPTALGSVSISGRWRDTKPHSVGSIRSNHIPLQSALPTDSTKTN